MTNLLLVLALLAGGVAFTVVLIVAALRRLRVRSDRRSGDLGSVSRQWLMVHRTEN